MNIRSGLAAILFAAICSATLSAQKAKKSEEDQIPEPEPIEIQTKDGVNLKCTWYAGTLKKQSVPIIMVHGWEGQRGEFDPLAKGLQSLGHAVICPDLRGHGESLSRTTPDGGSEEIDLAKLKPKDLEGMIYDLQACKKFLLEKNNAGELNINSLCVIGSEFGCIVAMQWAAYDWSAPILPALKQGQDVKAMVLLSPVQAHKGLRMSEALSHPAVKSKIAMMIVAGKQDRAGTGDAKRIHSTLVPHHPKPSGDAEEDRRKLDLFLDQPETSLRGTELLNNALKIPNRIANFIKLRLADRQDDNPWSDRTSPLGN